MLVGNPYTMKKQRLVQTEYTEAIVQMCSIKQMYLKLEQKSGKNIHIHVTVSYMISLHCY